MQTREHPKQCVSARIIIWRVQSSTIRFVQSYATIADVDKRETDHCSEMLQEVVKRIPGRDFKIIMGDWKVMVDSCRNTQVFKSMGSVMNMSSVKGSYI